MSCSDFVLPFLLYHGAARGRLVRLSATATDVLARHDYPFVVSRLLAEAMVLAAAWADLAKSGSIFTLQASGDGPLRHLAVDVSSSGDIRAYAGFDETALSSLALEDAEPDSAVGLHRLFGSGHVGFAVDQETHMGRRQGIAPLEGQSLSDCICGCFRHSEQLETALKTAVLPPQPRCGGVWRAAAVMVQRMPAHGGFARPDADENKDRWRTAVLSLAGATDDELTSLNASGEELLHRLFHPEALILMPPKPRRFACRCSRDKVLALLDSFSSKERAEMRDADGNTVVQCRFCSVRYVLSPREWSESMNDQKDASCLSAIASNPPRS